MSEMVKCEVSSDDLLYCLTHQCRVTDPQHPQDFEGYVRREQPYHVGDCVVRDGEHYRVDEVKPDGTLVCSSVIEILPGRWGTVAEARAWFSGGPVLPQQDAVTLATDLERLARELRSR